MILLVILSRFVLAVDSMYINRVRKIVVSTQIVRDFCCLIKKDRHMNLSKLSRTFAVYLIQRNNIVQIYEQVVSDIENKDTHCKFLHWLQNSDYFILLTSTVVEYYYFGRPKMCKIKMEPFLKQ